MTRSNFKVLNGGLDILNQTDFDPTEIATENSDMFNPENEPFDFDKFVSHYYYLKSVEQNLSSPEALVISREGSEELAERLLKAPVSEPRQLLLKLNILDNELSNDMDCTQPVGRKHLTIFAALKADIITLMAEFS
jgi:hypothetical protein